MRVQTGVRGRLHVPVYATAPALLLLVGGILAMVLTASTSTSTGLIFTSGSDNQCSSPPVYPCESVSIDGTGTAATVGISFPRSNVSSPQPAAYYTDLVEIHNVGSAPHTIASLNVTEVTGAAYLGKITVYYCITMTEDPASSSNCADFSIVGASGGFLTGNNVLPATLNPGKAGYIEVVAFASDASSPSDVVTFVLEMSASFPSTTTQLQGGGGAPPASSTSSSTSTSSTPTTTLSTTPTVTVTVTATKTATSTSTTVSTSLLTSVSTSTATETLRSTTTSTATQTSTATKVSTTTQTTEVITTLSAPVLPGPPLWVLLLVILALAAGAFVLIRRWLKRRGRTGARLFWQT